MRPSLCIHFYLSLDIGGMGWDVCLFQSLNICVSTTASPSEHSHGWGGPDQDEGRIFLNLLIPLEGVTQLMLGSAGTQQPGTVRSTPPPPPPLP
jgi:hypothetical protein